MDTIFLISSVIYILGAIISASLLYVYVKNYRHIKSHFNMGLIIFATLFLIDNLISLHQVFFAWPPSDGGIVSHILVQDLIDLVGLSALLYITWK